jgi:hypothetical protein
MLKSLYTSCSLKTVASKSKYKLNLVGVQEFRSDEGGMELADNYTLYMYNCTIVHFFYRSGNANHHLGTGFFIHKGIISS